MNRMLLSSIGMAISFVIIGCEIEENCSWSRHRCGHGCISSTNNSPTDTEYTESPVDTYTGFCQTDEDCRENEVCNTDDKCIVIVENCPLTAQCLGDPEGYAPPWKGIDPSFVGFVTNDENECRLSLDVDFYKDHLYGQGKILCNLQIYDSINLIEFIMTGNREGEIIKGQLTEDGFERSYDAVFEAKLPSGSEIVGTLSIVGDWGTFSGAFHLFRVSPCGCDDEIKSFDQPEDSESNVNENSECNNHDDECD